MEKVIYMFSKGLHYVAQGILLLMMVLITVDVLGRSLFNQPIKGTFEFTELGLALVVFFGLSYTHLMKEHISIDFLVEKFPEKIQFLLNSMINFVIAVLMSLVSWKLWENSQRLLHSKTVTGDLKIPLYIFLIMAAMGTFVFVLTALLNAIISIQRVVKNNES